jgi:ABC-type oligopeptide transport system substrate-binding subunit
MTSFLIETSYDDEHTLRVFTAEDLSAYLTRNIQNEHYSGEADVIHGIYRYDSPGKLTELVLTYASGTLDSFTDYMDWTYDLREKAHHGGDPVATFTVRIDGRA